MIIDVHAHGVSEDFIHDCVKNGGWNVEIAGPRRYVAENYGVLDPLLYDIGGRVASLRQRAIGLQLVSPPPPLAASLGHAADIAFARRLNASTARLVADGEGLFAGLAVPALGDPAGAPDELRRAMAEHGFRGVLLPTMADNVPLDDPRFAPLFAVLEELDLLVFMHPVTSALSAPLRDYTLMILIGWPTETSLAVARLVFAGVLERHPRLKLVLAHGGGTLPSLQGRLDLGYSAPVYEANPACRAHISRPPSTYLKQLYFDTTVCDRKALAFLIEQVGTDHVLFGSDFPYEIGDADGAIALPAIEALPEASRDKVLFKNAVVLMGLDDNEIGSQ